MIKMNKWIPCSERLPEIRENVLITLRSGEISVAFRSECFFYVVCLEGKYVTYENVLAWMPLPEPYKEEEE